MEIASREELITEMGSAAPIISRQVLRDLIVLAVVLPIFPYSFLLGGALLRGAAAGFLLLYMLFAEPVTRRMYLFMGLLPFDAFLQLRWSDPLLDYFMVALTVLLALRNPKTNRAVVLTLVCSLVCIAATVLLRLQVTNLTYPLRIVLCLVMVALFGSRYNSHRFDSSVAALYVGIPLLVASLIALTSPSIVTLLPSRDPNAHREIGGVFRFGALYENPGESVKYFLMTIVLLFFAASRGVTKADRLVSAGTGLALLIIGYRSLSKQYLLLSVIPILQLVIILFAHLRHGVAIRTRVSWKTIATAVCVFVCLFAAAWLLPTKTMIAGLVDAAETTSSVYHYRFGEQVQIFGLTTGRVEKQLAYLSHFASLSIGKLLFGHGWIFDYATEIVGVNGSPENLYMEFVVFFGLFGLFSVLGFYAAVRPPSVQCRVSRVSDSHPLRGWLATVVRYAPLALFVATSFTLPGVAQFGLYFYARSDRCDF